VPASVSYRWLVFPLEVQWEHTTQNAIVIFGYLLVDSLLAFTCVTMIGHLVHYVSKQSLLRILNRVGVDCHGVLDSSCHTSCLRSICISNAFEALLTCNRLLISACAIAHPQALLAYHARSLSKLQNAVHVHAALTNIFGLAFHASMRVLPRGQLLAALRQTVSSNFRKQPQSCTPV